MRLSDVKFSKTLKITNMLLPDNIHPENSIYFNASLVLETLQEFGKLDMLDLYQNVTKNKKMSLIKCLVLDISLHWPILEIQINHIIKHYRGFNG